MKKENKHCEESELVPFQIIQAATSGDVEAINDILNHYEKYIISLSIRMAYDEFGQLIFYVDETLKRRLETKLITKILSFEIT